MQQTRLYTIGAILAFLTCMVTQEGMIAATSRPGKCQKSDDCQEGYECISVETDIAGLENVAQCVPSMACGGVNSGYCPTFSSWPKSYRDVAPVCAFIEPNNCKQDSNSNSYGLVDCFRLTINNETRTGIYSCVDIRLFKSRNLGITANLTQNALETCKSSNGTAGVCNGQGTCSPVAALDTQYGCLCNSGYSGGSNNCFNVTSNECNNFGQCGEGGECDTVKKECACEDGVGGNQCGKCIDGDPRACGGHGTCTNGVCKCKENYRGTFCNDGYSSAARTPTTAHVAFILTTFLLAITLHL